MGVVIVGPWKPRPPSASERIEHEKSILRRIAELQRLRSQDQTAPKGDNQPVNPSGLTRLIQ